MIKTEVLDEAGRAPIGNNLVRLFHHGRRSAEIIGSASMSPITLMSGIPEARRRLKCRRCYHGIINFAIRPRRCP